MGKSKKEELTAAQDYSSQHKPKPVRDPEEEGPDAQEFWPQIKPGDYEAVCYKTETGKSWGNRRSLFLKFRIYGGEYDGTELFMVCPYPKGQKLSRRTKYYHQWMFANGGPPARGQRLARKVFLHRMYKVLVVDTQRKRDNGTLLPDFAQYSIISTILEVMTGGPPQ
ncbi:MAG: hypothetical protein GY841_23860 [FCB group bacterium]|nr:hypothetical protein [FCB group bacterium]